MRSADIKTVVTFTAIFMLLLLPSCQGGSSDRTQKKLARIEKSLVDFSGRLDQIEDSIKSIEENRMATDGALHSLRDRLDSLENKTSQSDPAALETATPVKSGDTENSVSKSSGPEAQVNDFFAQLKKEIKKELKEDKKVEEAKKRKKQAEQYVNYAKADYQKRMDGFRDFAEKNGLSGTQEASIREIAEESFQKILEVLNEAWNSPPEEVDWGKVKERTQEIYREAENEIKPFVTEEQGIALKKYFGLDK